MFVRNALQTDIVTGDGLIFDAWSVEVDVKHIALEGCLTILRWNYLVIIVRELLVIPTPTMSGVPSPVGLSNALSGLKHTALLPIQLLLEVTIVLPVREVQQHMILILFFID